MKIDDDKDYLASLNQKKDSLEDMIAKLEIRELEYIDKWMDRSYSCS